MQWASSSVTDPILKYRQRDQIKVPQVDLWLPHAHTQAKHTCTYIYVCMYVQNNIPKIDSHSNNKYTNEREKFHVATNPWSGTPRPGQFLISPFDKDIFLQSTLTAQSTRHGHHLGSCLSSILEPQSLLHSKNKLWGFWSFWRQGFPVCHWLSWNSL